MKKGLHFTKAQLEELYVQRRLSLIELGKKFDCESTNILYWLKKLDIPRRAATNPLAIHISKEVIHDLYWNKGWTTQQIADKFGIRYGRSILKKMKKYGIPSKTLSEANTTKRKDTFCGNLAKKAYLLGLRAGDFHAKWMKRSIRAQTTTTHLAQVELTKQAFSEYGEVKTYLSKNKARDDEWFVYVDLHPSFEFLVEKPQEIPEWILNDDLYFYQFLTAYMDCEGSWQIQKSHELHIRFIFRITNADLIILEQIKKKLELLKYNPNLYLTHKKGKPVSYGAYRNDIYQIFLYRKNEVLTLAKILYPISKHSEKTRKMNFILNNHNFKWNEVQKGWLGIRNEIKKELLKNQI